MADRTVELRRRFLACAGGAGLVIASGASARGASDEPRGAAKKEEEDVSPAEDLMREHGVLDRVLLIYEESLRRLDLSQELDPAVLVGSAGIIRRFIEDYHEKLEEDQLFPRFEKARTLVELVTVLRAQHQAGRGLTEEIQRLASAPASKAAADRARLVDALRRFIRMYRPHAAREDTVLFPALRKIVSAHEYDAMGDDFEAQEHRLFGQDGFEKTVDEVARLERRLGIEDLARFTA